MPHVLQWRIGPAAETCVDLVDALARQDGGRATQPDIKKAWKGDKNRSSQLLKLAVDAGRLEQDGSGRKGDPYCYTIRDSA